MFSKSSLFSLSATLLFAVNATAKVVTQDVAQDIVKNFMVSNGISQKEMVIYHSYNDDTGVLRAPLRDEPAYHIFKATDSNDFIIVAGDDIARPILGYSFSGTDENPADFPPAMQDWLDDIEKQIFEARNSGIAQSTQVARQWRTPEVGNVIKQLNTAKWNQQYPFNLQCPLQDGMRCYTGCTSTAYAIIMKYYGYPSAGRGVTPSYTCPTSGIYVASRDLNHSYDWDSMPNEYNYGQFTDQQANSVSRLMADIGAALQADYTNRETSAYYNKSAVFAHFGYNVGIQKRKSDYTSQEWYSMLRNELDKNRPVLYNGTSDQGLGSHAFIIDGYTDQDLFVVNWGWGGSYDGAYALDALELDFIDYKSGQAAYFDLQPADGLESVAIVNDNIECPSVEAAVGLAPHNGQPTRITLLQDNATDEVIISRDQNVILNLNGHTIELESIGFFNRGYLTVTDSTNTGKITVTKGNFGILNNYGNLTVEGVELTNLMDMSGDTDYRRCIWSDAGTTTVIKSGKYTSNGQVICANGGLTIENGDFECKDNNPIIVNYCFTDSVVIGGGNYVISSSASTGNASRALWSASGTVTHIKDGTYNCFSNVLCSNGRLTIDGGLFTSTGNDAVISNYSTTDTLIINGGTFKNTNKTKESADYRRAIWTYDGSATLITEGQFSSANQVLTFNGNATIDNATIDNTADGTGILSYGKVVIKDCKLNAKKILAIGTGHTIKCYGGLYSAAVGASFIASGYYCSRNYNAATSSKYPYKVVKDNTAVEAALYDARESDIQYDLNGTMSTGNKPGIQIIRMADGKTVKILNR